MTEASLWIKFNSLLFPAPPEQLIVLSMTSSYRGGSWGLRLWPSVRPLDFREEEIIEGPLGDTTSSVLLFMVPQGGTYCKAEGRVWNKALTVYSMMHHYCMSSELYNLQQPLAFPSKRLLLIWERVSLNIKSALSCYMLHDVHQLAAEQNFM